ncbi:Ras-related protein [Collichthys lucidus]|uniref:Ras-related protein n=1 Tax=Collichthys lucidus TaxID=240159 RepID=A0A4U5VRT8_COLLU|nr:Ras-related protein [Collichthys lucidus]
MDLFRTGRHGDVLEEDALWRFQIILIGDSDVGKTCVVQNFKSGIFSEKQQNTIGVDFSVRTMDIEGKKVKVSTVCGQERFRTITQSYYRSAHGAIIAYDITRRPTFDSVAHWIKEVELYGANNVLLVLIGNKCDLEQERQVPFEEACIFAKETGILAALETSAKVSQNVEEAFTMMARELLARNGLLVKKEDEENINTLRVLLRSNSRPVNGNVAAYAAPEKTCC